jgi:hypothetical protein
MNRPHLGQTVKGRFVDGESSSASLQETRAYIHLLVVIVLYNIFILNVYLIHFNCKYIVLIYFIHKMTLFPIAL